MKSIVAAILVLMFAIWPSSAKSQAVLKELKALNAQSEESMKRLDIAKTEKTAERAVALVEKHPISDSYERAKAYFMLAEVRRIQADFQQAELLFKQSLTILEASSHLTFELGVLLNQLGQLYAEQERLELAEQLLKRSVNILKNVREKAARPKELGFAIHNLASSYLMRLRLSQAEPLFHQSLDILRNTIGSETPRYANVLNGLASVYFHQGRLAQAEKLLKQTLAIREKILGSEHEQTAISLNNLGELHRVQRNFVKAEQYYKRAYAIVRKIFGPDHPHVRGTLGNLAVLQLSQKHWSRATEYLEQVNQITLQRWQRGKSSQKRERGAKDPRQRSTSSFTFSVTVKSMYRTAAKSIQTTQQINNDSFLAAQWATGSASAESLAQMAAREAKGDPKLIALTRTRQDLVAEWEKRDSSRIIASSRPSQNRKINEEKANQSRLAEIDTKLASIDKELATQFPEYIELATPQPLNVDQTRKFLGQNEALLLFHSTPFVFGMSEETFIWVITKTNSRWVRSELGGQALAKAVKALRCGLDSDSWKDTTCLDLLGRGYGGPGDAFLPFELRRAHKLYQSLFGQVEDLIAGKDLLIVPSGPLTLLPFQVLVTEKPDRDELSRPAFSNASWLIKKHAITVLPSVSSLRALRAHAKTSKADRTIIGFGNPLLNGGKDPDRVQSARSIRGCARPGYVRTANLRAVQRATIMPMGHSTKLSNLEVLRAQLPLPETADELCAVARSAGSDIRDLYLGQAATENRIKDLSASGELAKFKMLHFATHGALAGELSSDAEPGLILTPPGKATPKDDGYLSASEVASLKLDADWVILSACNTAGGETKNAEALSGLAKAFFYAGARSLLVSHWYVDSHATVDLITTAFRVMRDSPELGRAKAMQFAMLSLLAKGQHEWHPAYWAPFVVVGEGAG